MRLDMLIKSACDDWSAQARVPAGLAERTLRRRARRRSIKIAFSAGATALVAGGSMAIVTVTGPAKQPPRRTIQPVTLSADTTLRTDLGDTFPHHLVAAGHTAVAAYYTTRVHDQGGKRRIDRTWHLYDPATGTYRTTSWAYLDVAPGMHQAAVLAGPLPTSRVGVLDMRTRKVVRWISVDHRVGGVSWAPDGRRLLLTTYGTDPDVVGFPRPPSGVIDGKKIGAAPRRGGRTGFYVADAATGGVAGFHPLGPVGDNDNTRQDLGWSRSGRLIWAPTATAPTKVFYDLDGHRQPTPRHEAETDDGEAGLSPDGTLLPKFGPPPGPAVTVTNVVTGKRVAVLPIEQAKAWADDHHLFAIGCDPKKCTGKGEFHNRLLLVSLAGKITPLTGYRRSDRPGTWVPLFTHR